MQVEDLNDETSLECPICFENTEILKTLGCDHEICFNCIQILGRDHLNGKIKGPFCRMEVEVSQSHRKSIESKLNETNLSIISSIVPSALETRQDIINDQSVIRNNRTTAQEISRTVPQSIFRRIQVYNRYQEIIKMLQQLSSFHS